MADSLLSAKQTKKHRLEMQDRASLSVSGIDDVISYDENCIVLATVCGILSIDGAEMRIVNLDVEKGDIEIYCQSVIGNKTVNTGSGDIHVVYKEGLAFKLSALA